jgi:hypothetical protein
MRPASEAAGREQMQWRMVLALTRSLVGTSRSLAAIFSMGCSSLPRPWRLRPLAHSLLERNRREYPHRMERLQRRGRLPWFCGNMEEVIQNAHAVHNVKFDKTRSDVAESSEVYDCVVVSGGHAGLFAGLFLCPIIFNHWSNYPRQ